MDATQGTSGTTGTPDKAGAALHGGATDEERVEEQTAGDDRPEEDRTEEVEAAAAAREEEPTSGIEANLKSRSTWIRALFMIVIGALYGLAQAVVFAVVVLQFFWMLFTGENNRRLTSLGHSLALYSAELIAYLSYVTEERPFPFDKDWPPAR